MTEKDNTTSQRHPHAHAIGELAFASRASLELAGAILQRSPWPRGSSGARFVGPLPGEAGAELEVSISDIHDGTVFRAAILADGHVLITGTYVVVDWRDVGYEEPESAVLAAVYDLEAKVEAARVREARRFHALGEFIAFAEAA